MKKIWKLQGHRISMNDVLFSMDIMEEAERANYLQAYNNRQSFEML